MCKTCGCHVTHGNAPLAATPDRHGTRVVTVLQNLMSENDRVADHNRRHLADRGVLAINLMSAPGSGKTRLLEATIDALQEEFRIAVIEGDLETDNDAARIRAHGVPAIQITTGSACHLDAHLVHEALHQLPAGPLDLLFIENVGNLVCPASFDLGQHANITLLSVTEGDDKPAKYPVMFRAADLVLLTKTDLLEAVGDFWPGRAEQALRALASPAPFLHVSAKTGDGLEDWLDWLRSTTRAQVARRLQAGQRNGLRRPPVPAGPVSRRSILRRLPGSADERHG